MSYPRHIQLISVGALLLFLAAGGLGGCAFPRQCGDARVTYPKANFFADLTALGMTREGYFIELPMVSLSKEGTTEFQVSKLPPGVYDYSFSLNGGSLYSDENGYSPTPVSASHVRTVVSFRAILPEGRSLFSSEIRFGDLRWHRSKSNMIPVIDKLTTAATDFRLLITVRHPSSAQNEKMRIVGFGGVHEGPVIMKRDDIPQ